MPKTQKGEPWYANFDPGMTTEKLHGCSHITNCYLANLELADEFTDIYKNCGETLAIKRYKNGNRPVPKGVHDAPSTSAAASKLPPPPLAPVLEQKQKKVALSEYKSRQHIAGNNERPIDPQANELQHRKSFIPDFSNPANMEIKEFSLPAGISIPASMRIEFAYDL